ncbi:D-glycero-beta-D-manno-heptose 1,7-bisphosphate 7-phosphatase [Pseudoxanthomonas mexicana]|uniref:D-glycero-beta-D-manno-heptose 1,7-bisphosphate 7-phosphatase n=1 Tax=Pseudoxanthomonas mexicana TaxID=128785 RepID=UPI001CA4607B|nr:D-glycero-beta-D-manno-heptose 1,7-bisphosphate 7-phosphatase [Pseudoxanthomonas mexicana]WBX94210.1 D-glycero-beta-D-manno-heptose 1,7-bisphosphate 7-phosphatase [Pseudoxanthomonas mexicana]
MAEKGPTEHPPAVADPLVDPAFESVRADGAAPRRALFLDRDGVINVDHGYVHRPEDTQFVDGIFDVCRAAAGKGCLLVVVTNQAGIGRGYYSREAFLDYMAWMHSQFRIEGAPLAATYYCPHHPTEGMGDYRVVCTCRKPQPGMLLAAERRFGIDMAGSVLIGDTVNDMLAGAAAGVGQRWLLEGHDQRKSQQELPPGAVRLRVLADLATDRL